MKRLIALTTVLAIGVAVTSCNKVKKTSKKLEGDWEMTEMSYSESSGLLGDSTMTYPEGERDQFTFHDCSAKDPEDRCDGTITSAVDGTTSPFQYSIGEDGETLDNMNIEIPDLGIDLNMDMSLTFDDKDHITASGTYDTTLLIFPISVDITMKLQRK